MQHLLCCSFLVPVCTGINRLKKINRTEGNKTCFFSSFATWRVFVLLCASNSLLLTAFNTALLADCLFASWLVLFFFLFLVFSPLLNVSAFAWSTPTQVKSTTLIAVTEAANQLQCNSLTTQRKPEKWEVLFCIAFGGWFWFVHRRWTKTWIKV